jgi:hypothetical protein
VEEQVKHNQNGDRHPQKPEKAVFHHWIVCSRGGQRRRSDDGRWPFGENASGSA